MQLRLYSVYKVPSCLRCVLACWAGCLGCSAPVGAHLARSLLCFRRVVPLRRGAPSSWAGGSAA
jgi:hypothetical protein